MYWPDRGSGVPAEPERRPVASLIRQYFTEGGLGQVPTIPGADWFNQVTNELLNVVSEAGFEPSKLDDTQISESIKVISAASANELAQTLQSSSGSDFIKTPNGSLSVQDVLDKIAAKQDFISKGASIEDGRQSCIGDNHVSTMRAGDASHVFGSAGFTLGGAFVGDGSQCLAAWPLSELPISYVCQARILRQSGVDNAFIGYNTSPVQGMTALESFYSVGMTSAGFAFNDKVAIDVLVPAAQLSDGWYEVTMFYYTEFLYVSLCKQGSTKAKSFLISKVLPKPVNAQIGCYSSSDVIRDFRYCSTPEAVPFSPPTGPGRAMPTPIIFHSVNPSGVAISVHLPAGYDPRITHRLAVYCHGSGGTNTDFWDYDNENSVLSALLDAGYVVMAANYGSAAWGNQSSVTQNKTAIQYVKERYNVFEKPFFVVQSMGGMVGLNTVLVGGVTPAAIAGIYPASNLRWQYDHGFTSAIETAYGFSGSAAFDAATSGFDALNDNPPERFYGMKMKFWHSPADTIVSKAQNTDLLKAKVEAGGGFLSVVVTTGEHGDPSSFDGQGIVQFFSSI